MKQPHARPRLVQFFAFFLYLAMSPLAFGQEFKFLVSVEQGGAEVKSDSFAFLQSFGQPLHGTLVALAPDNGDTPTLWYEPDLDGDFWTLGSDRFDIVLDQGTGPQSAQVQMVASSRTEIHTLNDFEERDPVGEEVDEAHQLEVSTRGKIVGEQGVLVDLRGNFGVDAYIAFPMIPAHHTRGGGDRGGCAEIFEEGGASDRQPSQEPWATYLAEGSHLGTHCENRGGCTFSIFQTFDSTHQIAVFEVEMSIWSEGASLRLKGRESASNGLERVTPWIDLANRAHRIRIDWWLAEQDVANGGAMLRLDGQFAGELRGLNNSTFELNEVRVGALDPAPGVPAQYRLDHLTTYGGDLHEEITTHQMSDFEEDLAPWHVTTGAGFVRRSEEAALDGFFGLETEVGKEDGWGAFLRDNTLQEAGEVRTRFSLLHENLALGVDESALILAGYKGTHPADIQFKLRLHEHHDSTGGDLDPLLRASVTDGSGTWLSVASLELDPGRHDIEVQWHKSDHSATSNGCLRIWLEGNLIGRRCGLDLNDVTLQTLRLGLMDVQDNTTGSIFIDSVEVLLPN